MASPKGDETVGGSGGLASGGGLASLGGGGDNVGDFGSSLKAALANPTTPLRVPKYKPRGKLSKAVLNQKIVREKPKQTINAAEKKEERADYIKAKGTSKKTARLSAIRQQNLAHTSNKPRTCWLYI